jgi:LPS-assembly lipoprotein
MNFKIKFIALICLSIMMIACGFQLRGSIEADFKSIYVYGGSEGLNKHLIKRFKQSGIKIEESNPEKIIEILNDQVNKRILSLSSSGSVKEYELHYSVTYRFKSSESTWSNHINKEVIRDYTYDDNDRVAKELEEKNLVQGMRDEIVRSIVSQISVSK